MTAALCDCAVSLQRGDECWHSHETMPMLLDAQADAVLPHVFVGEVNQGRIDCTCVLARHYGRWGGRGVQIFVSTQALTKSWRASDPRDSRRSRFIRREHRPAAAAPAVEFRGLKGGFRWRPRTPEQRAQAQTLSAEDPGGSLQKTFDGQMRVSTFCVRLPK